MSTHVDDTQWDRPDASELDGNATVESYEVDGGVVFYDAENPLAWVETTQAVTLSDLA
ncbi:MAG: DUF7331 family protein [Halohasta sp.]